MQPRHPIFYPFQRINFQPVFILVTWTWRGQLGIRHPFKQLKKKIPSPRDTLINFKEGGLEGERKGEKHQTVVSCTSPDWESNSWPFVLQMMLQPAEPHWPGLNNFPSKPLSLASICRGFWCHKLLNLFDYVCSTWVCCCFFLLLT